MNKNILLLIIVLSFSNLSAQFITDGGDTLYGNEWIEHDQTYFKIPVAEDGIYRLSYEDLNSAGIPVSSISGGNIQVYKNGSAYPIYVTTSGSLSSEDYIEFYGQKNRGELDEIFYTDPESMQLNPAYSLFTDTAAYFLTWNSGSGNLRVNEVLTDLSGSTLTVEPYYMHKERLVQSSRLQKPTRNGADNVRYSHFEVGEGFGGNLARTNQVTLPATEIFESGPDPSIDIRFTSNGTAHQFEFSINGDLKTTWSHSGYLLKQEHFDFPLEELEASNQVRLYGAVDNFDRSVLAIIDLNYPRSFDFNDENYFEFFMPGGGDPKRVEISNFDGGLSPVVYDPGSGSRTTPQLIDDKWSFIIPVSSDDRNLVIYNPNEAVKEVLDIEQMDFVDYAELNHDFIIISHPELMEGSINQVAEYASYRGSAAGGSFDPIVVNVEDLYEQFSYGIHRHSYSVKNFVNWASRNWSNAEYVFLLGKGREYGVYRTKEQIEDFVHRSFYIPTYGIPASDNLLTSTGNIKTTHAIPTGRIAAKDSEDIEIYLRKVKEHEDFDSKAQTVEDKLWKKKIMHLAGAETSLQESIGNYLETMENAIEDSQYGADVVTFKKSSTETIQEADADELLNAIDAGLSVLTFFGHSSVGTFDFNIDDVNKLKNFGKYPLVISLGCFSGNVHTSSYGISEQYVLTEGKGAIAFVASSSTAYVSPQGNFGIDYYEKLGNEYYGRSLGEIFTSALREKDDLTSIHPKILNEQMTLHGDPSLRLSTAEGPDYVFDHKSFTTDPSIIESNSGSFDLSFKVANLGRYEEDSLSINLQHIKSSGEISTDIDFKIPAPRFDTLVSVSFENDDNANVGRNLILGTLDKEESITEIPAPQAEENNTIIDADGEDGFAFFAINNSAIPVSPCDFAIYNKADVVLRASTYNALANQETKYIFELDTSGVFDSPLKQKYEVSSIGGLLEWAPDLNFESGKSYYWRVSPDSVNTDIGYRWEEASFVYLPNSSNGWNQSHHYQYLDNDFDGIYIDENRKFQFDTAGFFIKIFNGVWDPNIVGYQFDFESTAASIRPWSFMDEGIAVVVGDQFSGAAWTNSGGDFGSVNTNNFGSFRCFAYPADTEEDRANLIDLIDNVVPDSSFIFLFSVLRNFDADFKPENWLEDEANGGRSIYNVLEEQGAILSRELINKGSVPYTFIYQKGVEKITEEIGETNESLITSTAFIPVRSNNGEFTSSKIGPAKSWSKLLLNLNSDNVYDTTYINVIGISNDGDETLIKTSFLESEIDLSDIDSNLYPYLKINLDAKDEENISPAQLDFWRVMYEGYPDLNINTSENFTFTRDTLQQGEDLELSLQFNNISDYEVDSVSVNILISDQSNQTIVSQDTVTFANSDQVIYSYKYNTAELMGRYQISININEDQAVIEKTFVNNFGVREFVVIGDELNPSLDISFDGSRIIDGDIISPKPFINIELRDENKYLLLDDPSLIEIAIIHPDNTEELISFDDERINFIAATEGENNQATIEFQPEFLVDGIYQLQVKASDRSNNISGDLNYERSFEIINEQMISNVLNYPNPFSTSTEFVFTLTGVEVPDEIIIQILTVSGKIVKEIVKEELGPLKIGVNRTTYKYDGTDDYGNRLANGVYLYRVVSRTNNESVINYRIEEISSQFKNNLGKMVILR